ncbi:MAG: DUF4124 domain-containing protein [Gammaproteobacteria bacterium]|nr:DUF4124 domain-containing protein [Gammaproteobacteria bacterium]
MNIALRKLTSHRLLWRVATMLAAGLLLTTAALAGTYKWVDEDGKVHYSDQPVEGAERVDLPKLPTYSPPPSSQRDSQSDSKSRSSGPADAEAAAEQEQASYRDFSFISPKPEQVFWNLGGRLPVQMSLTPGLREGDRIVLFLNGEQVEVMTGLGTTLTDVWRGAYTLRAVIQGPDGAARASIESGTFYVKQHSVAN